MSKKLKKHWKRHKCKIIGGAQILTFLSIVSAILTIYLQVAQNRAEIKKTNKWVGQDFSNHTAIGVSIQKQVNTLSNKVENLIN